jgi:AhpC/TSA family
VKLLERLTYCALIGTSCLSTWVLIQNQILGPRATRHLSPRSLQGESISLGDVNWERAPRTVLLVLSARCHWCNESVPLYQRVSTLHKKGAFQLIAVSTGTKDELAEFLNANRIEVDRIVTVDAAKPGISGVTPNVLLVDRHGKVVSNWLGAMQPSTSSAFLEELERLS